MSDTKAPQRLKLVAMEATAVAKDKKTPPVRMESCKEPVADPSLKMKRSGSLTGLNSLHKGVSDLEQIVNEQRTALGEAINHLAKQEGLIRAYQNQLEEHEQVIDQIING